MKEEYSSIIDRNTSVTLIISNKISHKGIKLLVHGNYVFTEMANIIPRTLI